MTWGKPLHKLFSLFSVVWEEIRIRVGKWDFLKEIWVNIQGGNLSPSLPWIPPEGSQERSWIPGLLSTSPHLAPQTFLAELPRKMVCLGLLRGSCEVQLLSPPALATAQLPWREYSYLASQCCNRALLPAAWAKGQRRGRRGGESPPPPQTYFPVPRA